MENLEIENISLKESINLLNEELHKKQTEIMVSFTHNIYFIILTFV